MTRRDATWVIFKAASVAGAAEFMSAWQLAGQQAAMHHGSMAPPDPHNWKEYTPKFFSKTDFENLDAFSDILIPSDETPGAREAFVTPFIDFVVNAAAEFAPEMQRQWRAATSWLDQQNFGQMSRGEQTAFIRNCSAGETDQTKPRGPAFRNYKLIKDMTVHAYYTSRVGLVEALEYKGLAYLTEFPGCTHEEHHNV